MRVHASAYSTTELLSTRKYGMRTPSVSTASKQCVHMRSLRPHAVNVLL
jgi:hypothetical protein